MNDTAMTTAEIESLGLTESMIEALRDEAYAAGDSKLGKLADAALFGDRSGVEACAKAIANARAQEEV